MKLVAWALIVLLSAATVGCAKKTASEQLRDDMKKASNQLNKDMKDMLK